MRNAISEWTASQIWKQMDYDSRRPHQVPTCLRFSLGLVWLSGPGLNFNSDIQILLPNLSKKTWISFIQLSSTFQPGGVRMWGKSSYYTSSLSISLVYHLNPIADRSFGADLVHPIMTAVFQSAHDYFQQSNATDLYLMVHFLHVTNLEILTTCTDDMFL